MAWSGSPLHQAFTYRVPAHTSLRAMRGLSQESSSSSESSAVACCSRLRRRVRVTRQWQGMFGGQQRKLKCHSNICG
jgi:hypothetical protein